MQSRAKYRERQAHLMRAIFLEDVPPQGADPERLCVLRDVLVRKLERTRAHKHSWFDRLLAFLRRE
jgi:hypothetical protein